MLTYINHRFQHYRTGIDQIDTDHLQLLIMMSELEHSVGQPVAATQSSVTAIITLFMAHLAHEEQYMDKIQYPYAAYHKSHHMAILDCLRAYGDVPTTGVVKYATRRLSDRFMEHIDQHDLQLARYINAYNATD